MRTEKAHKKDHLFKAGVLVIVIYAAYFMLLSSSLYATFHEYNDLGISVYGLYFNTHYPQIASGIQFLEFDQHLSVDSLFLDLIYWAVQSPLTVLFIQVAFIAMTAIIILYIVRDLTRDGFMAFALSLAFLINPGTIGLMLYDSHIEFLILPFYVLTFYFYAKGRMKGLLLSLALLLGSADIAPFMALTLGFGLLAYELLYNRDKKITKTKTSFALAIILISIVALALYTVASAALSNSYQSSYGGLPQLLQISMPSQDLIAPSVLNNPFGRVASSIGLYVSDYKANLVYALLLAAFGFGLTLIAMPIVALLLAIPWLGGAFLLGLPAFLFPTTEYFGYILGPAVASATLGFLVIKAKRTYLYRLLRSRGLDVPKTIKWSAIVLPLLFSIVGPALYLLVYSPSSAYHTINTNNLVSLLLLSPNSTDRTLYGQLDYVIAQVPENVSVMTEYFIVPHLAQRKSVELMLDSGGYYFAPDYVLVDFNRNISTNVCRKGFDNCTRLDGLLATGNYTLALSNGTAMLYKRIG